MSVHPFIHLSICLSIQILIHPSIHWSVQISIYPSVRPFKQPFPSTHPSIVVVHSYLTPIICSFIHLSIHSSIHLFIHTSIYRSNNLFIHPSIQTSNQNNFNFQKCFWALNVRWHYNKAVLILDRWVGLLWLEKWRMKCEKRETRPRQPRWTCNWRITLSGPLTPTPQNQTDQSEPDQRSQQSHLGSHRHWR